MIALAGGQPIGSQGDGPTDIAPIAIAGRALLAVPIDAPGADRMVVIVADDQRGHWFPSDVALLRSCSHRISRLLLSSRIEGQLAASERHIRHMMGSVPAKAV